MEQNKESRNRPISTGMLDFDKGIGIINSFFNIRDWNN